ncbi:anillin isoform X1 [Salmo trutta]|uniref:Anillin n=2 Tax=Salmo trutta TaxID=8032 RepID=A0A674E4T1_SALTR|nr:anillin-like isoform X1 [Salmo trutta]
MDPFTEKLLERTRARRENLQKKMAERPTAANRQMAKRAREPLAETCNSLVTVPVIKKAPHPSSKPSPSKRSRSGERGQPTMIGEENREPSMTPRTLTPTLTDPQTDRKPPTGPASIHSAASSLGRVAVPPPAPVPEPEPKLAAQLVPEQAREVARSAPEPKEVAVSVAPQPQRTKNVEVVPACSVLQRNREEQREAPTSTPAAIKSRLARLAEQRQYWDSEGTSEVPDIPAALSPVKSQTHRRQAVALVPTPVPAAASSEAPVGRKGRLANLAASIGSWEDDLGHAAPRSRDYAQGNPGSVSIATPAWRRETGAKPISVVADRTQMSQSSNSIPVPDSNQQPLNSPVKSTGVVPPSPQKTEVPEARPARQTSRGLPSPLPSPQRSCQGRASAFTPSPQKGAPSASPVPQSTLKNQALSRALEVNASPRKSELPTQPSNTGPSVLQTRERFTKETPPSTPLQQRGTAGATGTPGVKSFMERFGERCQERSGLSSTDTSHGAAAHTPTVVNPSGAGLAGRTPVVSHSGTPNTRLVQERLRAAQVANTTTADLAQKQKLERESELAQIRNRFQTGNIWKIKDEEADNKRNTEAKDLIEQDLDSLNAASKKPNVPAATNPTSSPVKRVEFSVEESDEEESHELEVNVDQSINSDVINGIFDGLHDQSEVQSGEEEDKLNISSMSILAPFSETVAAVVKSPVKMMMSTPASSFNAKSLTPDSVSRPSKFQRARMLRAGSSDSLETDDGHNLPYSIDAYRSTRIKESTERPRVRQVIVRKEDVSRRAAEEPRSQGHTNIKQKMKVLTNELNLQQTVISQASQALNCCTDEEHGKGSQVEAEAERLLLIATEKRGALKAELDRLKGAGPSSQREQGGDMGVTASKGSISLLELRLPLKADFVCSTANNPEWSSHYFFIMIRAGAENTVATPLASTRSAISGDAITFSTKFTMPDVSNDFAIDIEVYCLVQKRELNLDKRKKPSKSKAITPKRFLAITKSSLTPVVASPGGPNAVRTSNFVLVGSHKLTLASIGKNTFSLEKIKYEGIERALLRDMFHSKVPFLCPLEGHLYLKMQCEVGSLVEERGFLTMFEDVSGFGAWHRRWCVLSGHTISYWTYPDDEKRKNPMGRINLANCTSRKVEPANREFCARPNTFELITVRPQRESDIETLVSQCKNTMCVTKNWLCADTKDERNVWMQKLNQILVDLRMWQPDSCYRPV